MTRTHSNLMQNELGKVNQRSIDSQAILSTALAAPITPAPPALPANNLLAQQLQMVARVIMRAARSVPPVRCFWCRWAVTTRMRTRMQRIRDC